MLKRLAFALLLPALPLAAASVLDAQSAGHSIDLDGLDRSVSPCADFYQFACGGWLARNPIPPDQPWWGPLPRMQERNNEKLREILDAAAAGRNPETKKIGDYYASCMDEATIDAKGAAPLAGERQAIASIHSAAELPAVVASLHEAGVDAFFGFGARPDYEQAGSILALLSPGGLGLPDRDYYVRDDPSSVTLRRQYAEHVQKMLALVEDVGSNGVPADRAGAASVLRIETALAKAQLDAVARREPKKVNHKMSVDDLRALAPHFDWAKYFAALRAPAFRTLNVREPEAVKAFDQLIATTPVADLRTYLEWQAIHAAAYILSTPFVAEDFRFFGTTLNGTAELMPRWKRCVASTDQDLGEPLGKAFVGEMFGPRAKADTLEMVHEIQTALEKDILGLDWMADATKKHALAKLHAVTEKIGYPDRWRDYTGLRIVRGDAFGNVKRASAFYLRRSIGTIGKPTDRALWAMTPPTVNAYYSAPQNSVNFPAGVLQPPLYTAAGDAAANYGGAGAFIAHELTHGFDDQGRKYDAEGNLHDWWTPADAKAFEQRAACLVDEYSRFVAVDDVRVNGELTLGENTADNGGVRLALAAYLASRVGEDAATIDGFTPQQRFFIGWGQIWCENTRPESERVAAQTDPHSPGRYRVNGVVSNMPEFRKAFSCPAGAPMVRTPACRVW
ncbi:MAG: M13 family metallopeptidase [Betaproteobacteria bacterium]